MEIEDEDEVVLEAASDRFFAFRREGGETLVGQEKDPPLGWEGNNYFSIDPIQIQPGQWFTEGNGYVYIKITNNDALTVKEVLVNQGMAEFAAFLLTFLIWAGGSYIGNIFFED
ncbi:hypothetical protein HY502_03300 [Candidatus Woesebacteria bacterium]|nr:hypothetical protein [Candidatus Woesebacteria bacterium]